MNVAYELHDTSGTLFFEWDARKASENHSKHGILFEDAAHIFLEDTLAIEDTSARGELREVSFGRLGNGSRTTVIICVVHTDRNGTICIISARKATAHEKRRYETHFTGTNF